MGFSPPREFQTLGLSYEMGLQICLKGSLKGTPMLKIDDSLIQVHLLNSDSRDHPPPPPPPKKKKKKKGKAAVG